MKSKLFSVNIIPFNPINKKVLVQLRDNITTIKHPNKWCILGGRSLHGESICDALARELKEETGIHLGQRKPIFLLENKTKTYQGDEIDAFYYALEVGGDFICGEGQELRFMSIDDVINKKNFIYFQKEIIINFAANFFD